MRLFLWSLTAALAGFLFGFDTVVISGAEQAIQKLWGLGDAMHGFAMAAALYGTVVGAILGGFPTDRLGRRRTLIAIGALYLISALWSALATGPATFIIARFLGGLGVGVSTVAAPLYIAEIAPPHQRGRLAGMFQFNIVLGILVAFLSNAWIGRLEEHAWRWMLAAEAVPALIYVLGSLTLPESPRWLLTRRGDRAGARRVLALVQPQAAAEALDALLERIAASAGDATARLSLARLRKPLLIAFLVAFFNQLSGINAILYFAPRIFQLTGLEAEAALLQSVGIGVTNLVFTFVGLALIDRLGRRTLLLVGSIGYIVSLTLTSWAYASGRFAIVPPCLFAFIAAHAVGQGAVIWVLIAEVFPNRSRAYGQALGSATHWVFAALITTVFPLAVATFAPATIFAFFAGMMVLQLLWVLTMVPETKGVPLETLERQLGLRAADP